MPSLALMMGAIALAVHVFRAITPWKIFWVAQLFALSWLFEWRMMFPAIPAFGLALLCVPGTWRDRAGRIGIFAVSGLVPAILWENLVPLITPEADYIPLLQILWTGKAVDSGYAGFTWNKVVFLFSGIHQYMNHGLNIFDIATILTMRNFCQMILILILIAGL